MKLELSWQGFNELDSIIRSADATEASEADAASESHSGLDSDENSMMVVMGGCLGRQRVYFLRTAGGWRTGSSALGFHHSIR